MNSLSDLSVDDAAEAAWLHSPLGIAVICRDGTVSCVNPAFESITEITASSVLGISEANFAALVALVPTGGQRYVQRRVDTTGSVLRAVYYFFKATLASNKDQNLSRIIAKLREPLASIYGFVELLATQDYDKEVRGNLAATLLEQVEVMSNMINEQLGITVDP